MDGEPVGNTPLNRYLSAVRQHWKLWVFPTMGCTALAIVYAFVVPASWEASQALHIREESIGNSNRAGQFESYDTMKTSLETLHAVAKNRFVLRSVLEEVGPPKKGLTKPGKWPTNEDVDDLSSNVSLNAPNGAVFGQTEVIYLNVKAQTPERAVAIAEILTAEIETRISLIRAEKAESLEQEMQQAVEQARSQLQASSDQLQQLEFRAGEDLAELRNLNQLTASNDGSMQQSLGRIRALIQAAQQKQAAIAARREYLASIQDDPSAIETVPTSVLAAHPSLGRLKQGLVDAMLRAAQTLASYEASHPRSTRAEIETAKIRQQLRQQVGVALQESEFDLKEAQQEEIKLTAIREATSNKIKRLTELRIEYNQLVDEVDSRKKDLEQVSLQLSEIRARIRAAENSSVISAIDPPVTGSRPVGPGKKVLAIGGLLCGLAIGFGLVVLAMPPEKLESLSAAQVQSLVVAQQPMNPAQTDTRPQEPQSGHAQSETPRTFRESLPRSSELASAKPLDTSRTFGNDTKTSQRSESQVESGPALSDRQEESASKPEAAFEFVKAGETNTSTSTKVDLSSANLNQVSEIAPANSIQETTSKKGTGQASFSVDRMAESEARDRNVGSSPLPKVDSIVRREVKSAGVEGLANPGTSSTRSSSIEPASPGSPQQVEEPFVPSMSNAPAKPVTPNRRRAAPAPEQSAGSSQGVRAESSVPSERTRAAESFGNSTAASAGELARMKAEERAKMPLPPGAGLHSPIAQATTQGNSSAAASASSLATVEDGQGKREITPSMPDPETAKRIEELKQQWEKQTQQEPKVIKSLADLEEHAKLTHEMGRAPTGQGNSPRRASESPSSDATNDGALINELQRLRNEIRNSS